MDMTPTIRRWAWFTLATLGVAAAWYALYANAISVAPPPAPIEGASQEHNVAAFLAWFRAGLWQDAGILLVATLGFLGLAGLGQALARQPQEDDPSRRIGWDTAGRIMIMAGIIGAVAQSIQLGGHQAVGVASGVLIRLEGVSLLHFTIDQIHAGLEVGVYGLFGAGLVAAVAAGRAQGASLIWSALGVGAAVALIVVAGSRLTSDPLGVADPLLFVAAFALFPAWAVGLPGALVARDRLSGRHAAVIASR
jgi:hypothetical protein